MEVHNSPPVHDLWLRDLKLTRTFWDASTCSVYSNTHSKAQQNAALYLPISVVHITTASASNLDVTADFVDLKNISVIIIQPAHTIANILFYRLISSRELPLMYVLPFAATKAMENWWPVSVSAQWTSEHWFISMTPCGIVPTYNIQHSTGWKHSPASFSRVTTAYAESPKTFPKCKHSWIAEAALLQPDNFNF